jgi:hypothetical protein
MQIFQLSSTPIRLFFRSYCKQKRWRHILLVWRSSHVLVLAASDQVPTDDSPVRLFLFRSNFNLHLKQQFILLRIHPLTVSLYFQPVTH